MRVPSERGSAQVYDEIFTNARKTRITVSSVTMFNVNTTRV